MILSLARLAAPPHLGSPPAPGGLLKLRDVTARLRSPLRSWLWQRVSNAANRHAALNDWRLYRLGWCNVCGRHSVFFCDDISLAREQLVCALCGATSRYRSIARGVLRAVAEKAGVRGACIATLASRRASTTLRLYDTQVASASYRIPDMLSRCPFVEVHSSLYKPSLPFGAALGEGVTNQNLEALTFDDATFDVVITSDVMEHVRLADRAHREIRRVLRPGGIYLFTVPHFRNRQDTVMRVRISDPEDPERDEDILPRAYHPDGNSESGQAIVYRDFGLDLDHQLEELGFEVDYEKTDRPETAILNTELFYCTLGGDPTTSHPHAAAPFGSASQRNAAG
jgi:SAM-dependent methyltransferase